MAIRSRPHGLIALAQGLIALESRGEFFSVW